MEVRVEVVVAIVMIAVMVVVMKMVLGAIEVSGLSITQQLQPIRMSKTTKKHEERSPCFPHKLKFSNGAKDWLIRNKKTKQQLQDTY